MFALVDINNFYASCEQLWAPKLRPHPLVVLSNNDGCVVARSREAKALGVPMGAPWFKLREMARQHGIVAMSSNYELYADMSRRVVQVLRDFAPSLEVYSIDESFLHLADLNLLAARREAYGQAIRQRVARWVGLPVCVGIAPSKTLAKLANHLAKKNDAFEGVCDWTALSPAEQADWMARYDVQEVWGVGRRIGRQLQAHGIHTVLDLARADPDWVRRYFSVVLQKTVQELNGQSCLPLEAVAPNKQQIIASRSFGRPVTNHEEMAQAVSTYVCRAAEKLRQQHSQAGVVTVAIMTNRFRPHDPQYHASEVLALPCPTHDSRTLVTHALMALQRIYRPGFAYKKALVMLSGLQPETVQQRGLWDSPEHDQQRQRAQQLMQAMDGLNARFGRGTVSLGAVGIQPAWTMQRVRVSPRYTTRWEDIPKVGAGTGLKRAYL